MARRNKLEILACILSLCKSGRQSKTKIVYHVNLNFKNAGAYLEWLTAHGYLEIDEQLYMITPSGRNLLASINNINSTIAGDDNCLKTKEPRGKGPGGKDK